MYKKFRLSSLLISTIFAKMAFADELKNKDSNSFSDEQKTISKNVNNSNNDSDGHREDFKQLEVDPLFRSVYLRMNRMLDEIHEDFDYKNSGGYDRVRDGRRFNFLNNYKFNIEIISNDKEYNVVIEVPGMEEKDIKIQLSGRNLRISGERNTEIEKKTIDNGNRLNNSYNSFERILSLPKNIDENTIKAKLKNGLLTISMNKKVVTEEKPKNIKIN